MMRSVWTVISTLAVANVLAVVLVMGWLAATDRVSPERLERVREVFAETLTEQEARQAEEANVASAEAALAAERAKEGKPPLTAEQRMDIIRDYSDLVSQRTERVRRETQDLIDTLMAQQSRLASEREAFEEEREAFHQMRSEIEALEGSEQFGKTLKIYSTVKSEEAARMMRALIQEGETDQVVAYLSALPPRAASKIVSEFEDDDAALAAGLLERLREYGLEPAHPEDAE